jgi:hypothetical protein
MQVPAEFRHLAQCFLQDMHLDASTEAEWITAALRRLDKPQQLVVKQFLTKLLRTNPDGKVLQAIWNGTDPNWGLPDDEELRGFLAMIRDAIQ